MTRSVISLGLLFLSTVSGMKLQEKPAEMNVGLAEDIDQDSDPWGEAVKVFKEVHSEMAAKIGLSDGALKQALHDIFLTHAGVTDEVGDIQQAKVKEFHGALNAHNEENEHEILQLRQMIPSPRTTKDGTEKVQLRQTKSEEGESSSSLSKALKLTIFGDTVNFWIVCSCPAYFAASAWMTAFLDGSCSKDGTCGTKMYDMCSGDDREDWHQKAAAVWNENTWFKNMGYNFARKMMITVSLAREVYFDPKNGNDPNGIKKFLVTSYQWSTGSIFLHWWGDAEAKHFDYHLPAPSPSNSTSS